MAVAVYVKVTKQVMDCEQCGETFSFKRCGKPRMFCSRKCCHKAKSARKSLIKKMLTTKCKQCEQEFIYKKGLGRLRKFCSTKCKNLSSSAAWVQTDKGKQSRNDVKKRRHHQKRAGRLGGEVFTSGEVFDRDGWRCQLCGIKVRRRRKPTDAKDPIEATIDHITPLSRGGKHSMVNCQCACRKCNVSKSNKKIGQLRLC